MRQRLARARIVCIIRMCHHAPVARASASPNVIARTAYGAISFASHVPRCDARECARGVRVVVECRARCARTFGFAIRIVNLMRAQDTRARTRSARYVVFGRGLSTGWRGRDWWIMHHIEGVLMGPALKRSVGHIDARSSTDIYGDVRGGVLIPTIYIAYIGVFYT